jgi:hypothetical protein
MLPIIMGRAETFPLINKDREFRLHLKNPSRPRTTSPITQRWPHRCNWYTISKAMSRLLPVSTTFGEDSKQLPTSSCRFGCPIKPWAVIPSSRMEWMRSCCHTSFSRPRLRFGRFLVSIFSLVPFPSAKFYHPRVFYGFFPHCFSYPCMLVFPHPGRYLIGFPFLCSFTPVNLPTSTRLFHYNPCTCACTCLSPLFSAIPN